MPGKRGVVNVARLVTATDAAGVSVIAFRGEVPVSRWRGVDGGDAVLWSTETVPGDNSEAGLHADDRKVGTTINGGAVFRVTELGPGFRSPMHRTESTDYGVVLSGTLEVELDSGQTATLHPGQTIVQRGTRHAWHNPSPDTPCTFAITMVQAHP